MAVSKKTEFKRPDRCKSHNKNTLGYLAWFDWADAKHKKGERQKQCPKCKRWFFKDEF